MDQAYIWGRLDAYWDWMQERESQSGYAKTAVKFLACCLRCLSRRENKFCLPLTTEHRTKLEVLKNSLIGLKSIMASPQRSGQLQTQKKACRKAFQDAFFLLATGHSDPPDGFRFNSPLYCFLAVSSVNRQGKFAEPKEMTSELAKWKFLLRCAVLQFARDHPHPETGVIGYANYQLVKG